MTLGAHAAAALALLFGGCAMFDPGARPTAATAPALVAVPLLLEVEAPGELRALLARHLDIGRLRELRIDAGSIGESETARLVAAAPVQARELLQTEGYFAPRIEVGREPSATTGGPDRVRLTVDPGPRTTVGRLTFEVEGELERAATAGDAAAKAQLEALERGWALPPGAAFRNPDWSDAKAAALARLRAHGYAVASWAGTGAEIDPQSHQARLFVVADSGPLFRSGALDIEGLVAHDESTVRYLANFEPGTPVTEALLVDFQERLQGAGLFDGVAVTLDTDPEKAAQARILVRLREAPVQVWTFALGVSANIGQRAAVEQVYRRVFGFAATARNKVEYGRLRRAWDGELSTHIQPDLYRNFVGGAVEWLQSDSDRVLSQRLRLGRARDTQRRERLSFVETERSSRRTGEGFGIVDNTYALSLNHHMVLRSLDSVILPTQGYSLSLQLGGGWSHGTSSRSGPFSRLFGRLTVYQPLGASWYGQGRLELGQVLLRTGGAVPQTQLFRAGGDDSVRGYAYRSLGPLVDGAVAGGQVTMTASAEVARPLSRELPSLWGALFVDAGNAANSFGNLSPVLGFGTGLRWRSPVGPLRLDWAWARELRRARLSFSVGIAL